MPWFHQRPNLLTMYGSLTPPPFQRRFTPLAAAGMQYYDLNTPFVATGDFEIEFDVYVSDFAVTLVHMGLSGTAIDFFRSTSVNTFDIRNTASGQRSMTSATSLVNNQFNTLTVKRVSGSVSVSVNNEGFGAATAGWSGDFEVDVLGQKGGGDFLTGYLANVSLQTAGDNRLYKLDENFGETSVAVDSIGGNNGTAINISESTDFVFDGAASPNTWTDIPTGLIVLEVAGTGGATKTLSLIAVGDSLTDQASTNDDIVFNSPWVWSAAYSGFDYKIMLDAGVAFDTVQQIDARFQTEVVDKNPDVVLYCGGTNNIVLADTPTDIFNVIVTSLQRLPSTTKILVAYLPYRTSNLGGDTIEVVTAKTDAVNSLIQNITATIPNAYPAGPYTEYDALPLEGDGDKGGTDDGLHWNYQGSYYVGRFAWAPVLSEIAPSLDISNELLANSELSGTGGNTGFGATGTVADGWRGTQGVYSVADGVQTIDISAGSSASFDQLNTDISAFSGLECQASIDIEIISGSLNIDQIRLRSRVDTGGTTTTPDSTMLGVTLTDNVEGKFKLTTQPFNVGTNTMLDYSLLAGVAASGDAVIKVSNPKCYTV